MPFLALIPGFFTIKYNYELYKNQDELYQKFHDFSLIAGFIGFAIFGLILHYVSLYTNYQPVWMDYVYAPLLEWLLVKYIFIKNFMNNENNIKQLRNELKISQKDLAESLSVSRQTINAIETGKFDPSLTLTIKITRFLIRTWKKYLLWRNSKNEKLILLICMIAISYGQTVTNGGFETNVFNRNTGERIYRILR